MVYKYKGKNGEEFYMESGGNKVPPSQFSNIKRDKRLISDRAVKMMDVLKKISGEDVEEVSDEKPGMPKKASIADIIRSYVANILKTEE